MKPLRFTERFKTLFSMAATLTESTDAYCVLLLLEGPVDWQRLKKLADDTETLVATTLAEELEGGQAGRAGRCLSGHAR